MNNTEKELVAEEVKNEESVQNTTEQVTPDKKKEGFGQYLKNVWLGFLDTFQYNPCKLPGILIALPGLFIGFFLAWHSKVRFIVEDGQLNLSGFYMFIMVLFGCINIFNGVTFSSKRNLGSLIISIICSLVIAVFGVLWIVGIANSFALTSSGKVVLQIPLKFDFSCAMSIIGVALAIICSVIGCLLGYFKYDRNYKKVVF